MPEIPELEYIRTYIHNHIVGRTIEDVDLRQPVVLRMGVERTLQSVLLQRRIDNIGRHGPFLRFELNDFVVMIVHLMLAGSIQHQGRKQRTAGYCCVSIGLDDGSRLNMCDPELMMKVYLVPLDGTAGIPKYDQQGVDVLSDGFTVKRFLELAGVHRRKQVRVFLRDYSAMSAIGNAYADEILFDARIHPKTFVTKLEPAQLETLFHSIRNVLQSGIERVAGAGLPIQKKVRDHLRVRNRRGEPCPRCGTKIRREGVRGHDVFFCPACQPATRKLFLDWGKIGAH